MKDIGEVLIELRIKYSVSISELSSAIGVSPTTINNWENGIERPSDVEIMRIISFYKSRENNSNTTHYTYNPNYSEVHTTPSSESSSGLVAKMMRFVSGENSRVQVRIIDLMKKSLKSPSFWIFVACLVLFALALALTDSVILIIITGSVPVPLYVVIFLYENNLEKNVSVKNTVLTFLIGGGISIGIALLAYSVFTANNYFAVAFIEEFAKVITSYFIIRKLKIRTILPALLIGAAVGAGFAMLESAEYAYGAFLSSGMQAMQNTIIVRAVTEFGTHAIWSAISASALVRSAQYRSITPNTFFNVSFLKVFAIPVGLHLLWNILTDYLLILVVIAIVGISLMFAMFNLGVKEYNKYSYDCFE